MVTHHLYVIRCSLMLHVLKVWSAHHACHGSGGSTWLAHYMPARGVGAAHRRGTCRNHSVVKTLRNNQHRIVSCTRLAWYLLRGKGVWLLMSAWGLHPTPVPHYRVGLWSRRRVGSGVCRWSAHVVVGGRGACSLVLLRHSPSVAW